MYVLKDWTAKRSGAGIRIKGKSAGSGETIKLNVETIRVDGGRVLAHLDGTDFAQLLV